MKKVVSICLVVLLMVGAVACSSSSGRTLEELIKAKLGTPRSEEDSGVEAVVHNEDEQYLTVKYRMTPVFKTKRLIEKQISMKLRVLLPKVVVFDNVDTVAVIVMLPVNDTWMKAMTIETSKESIQEIDWKEIKDEEILEALDSYIAEPWFQDL